jgi:hypothetical protein
VTSLEHRTVCSTCCGALGSSGLGRAHALLLSLLLAPACAPGPGAPTTDAKVLGDVHTGQYHLGPVDFAETEWHNACAPEGGYGASLRDATGLGGEYLVGVSSERAAGGAVCDACVRITTATGRAIVARVVTYGTSNAAGDVDVSPSVFEALHSGEYPRAMSWQLAVCPPTGPLRYEFQTEANEWWTSLWIRNPRVPLTKVEVKSRNHASFVELRRGTDGTLTDASGFGAGAFELRLTAHDGQTLVDALPSFSPGEIAVSAQQFH